MPPPDVTAYLQQQRTAAQFDDRRNAKSMPLSRADSSSWAHSDAKMWALRPGCRSSKAVRRLNKLAGSAAARNHQHQRQAWCNNWSIHAAHLSKARYSRDAAGCVIFMHLCTRASRTGRWGRSCPCYSWQPSAGAGAPPAAPQRMRCSSRDNTASRSPAQHGSLPSPTHSKPYGSH
jgi:hypothetical protein